MGEIVLLIIIWAFTWVICVCHFR